MRHNYIILLIFGIALVVAGCTVKHADFGIVGAKKIDLTMNSFEKVGEKITGESSSYAVLFIPVGHSTIEGAINNALQKVNGDVMTETTLIYKFWMIPPFYGTRTIEVNGTVWKQKGSAAVSDKK